MGFFVDAFGQLRAGGCHVDEISARLGVCNNAAFAKIDLLDVFWVTDDGDYCVAPGGAFGHAVTPDEPLANQCIGL
ncbi:hypothetical protein DSECCO2_580110 [anaerobic digester metagenome]